MISTLIALGMACTGDPMLEDATAYQQAVQPLLEQNTELANGFRDVAANVKRGRSDATGVATALQTQLIPASQTLAAQVQDIHPSTPELVEAHGWLVQAWAQRADAFEEIETAWKAEDPKALEQAIEQVRATHSEEQRWLDRTGALLAPYALTVDLYPPKP